MGSVNPAERRHVVDRLCEAFAEDRIGLVELERRLDGAARARSEADLRALLDGIPGGGAGPPGHFVEPVGGVGAGPPAAYSAVGTAPGPGRIGRVDASRVPKNLLTIAVWSGRSRKGGWILPSRITAVALMGGIELDFREALWGAPVTTVFAVALMGGIEILVPPGVNVDTSGFAIMGGFEDEAATAQAPIADAPTLRISGYALMGGIEIAVRHAGETRREARHRGRLERRLARERRIDGGPPGAS